MMEAASTSETSVNFYQTTRRYNPEDSHLHNRRRENLKFCFVKFVSSWCGPRSVGHNGMESMEQLEYSSFLFQYVSYFYLLLSKTRRYRRTK
jgi:hypothetical protein